MARNVFVTILIFEILVLTFSSCSKLSNSSFETNEGAIRFSEYSDGKELQIYGEVSTVEFGKGKTFEINSHIKNLASNEYKLETDGEPININIYKVGSNETYAGAIKTCTIKPNSTVDFQTTFTPKEPGDYIIYSSIYILTPIKYEKVLINKTISVK